jgi:glycosyltransferase involved in cell wall biosynthesis
MQNKQFYSIIWGYHKQIYNFPKEQNYHIHPLVVAKELGYSVSMISIDDIHPPEDDPNFPKDVRVLRFHSITSYLWFLIQNRDAAFYVNTLTIKSLIVWLFVKRSIFIPHDYIFGSNWIKKQIIRFFYRFFTKIRVNNPAEAHEINLLKNDLAEIVPLVINTKAITPPRHKHQFILLSLWNLIPKKNPELLLQALAETKRRGYSFRLLTIWSDRLKENGFHQSYNELIEKYELSHQVQYLWYLPFEEAREHIAKASIYVNMSSHEWLCIAVYESICAGLGVILPNILSFEWIFWEDAYIYKDWESYALADAIILAYKEQSLLPEKISHMQALIETGYNYENITHKLTELFKRTYEA